jgi:hypothetical protein
MSAQSNSPSHVIHLLTHDNQPVCGTTACRTAWHHAAWPSAVTLWPNACLQCWDQAHQPASRIERTQEVA